MRGKSRSEPKFISSILDPSSWDHVQILVRGIEEGASSIGWFWMQPQATPWRSTSLQPQKTDKRRSGALTHSPTDRYSSSLGTLMPQFFVTTDPLDGPAFFSYPSSPDMPQVLLMNLVASHKLEYSGELTSLVHARSPGSQRPDQPHSPTFLHELC